MRVRTQEEVCKAYGKKENNRKFVSSMIMKGEVVKSNWGYEFEIWDVDGLKDTVKKLKEENAVLKEENEKLKERVHELEEVCKDSLFGDNPAWGDTAKWDTVEWDIERELEELKVNYEYLHNKFQRLKKGYDLVIDLTYGYIRPHYRIEKSEYKEQLAESINEKLDDMFWRDE